MISVCQEKLIQIKEQETRVNRLQLELESLHISGLNSKQLKRANDAFEIFAKVIFRIYFFFQFIVSLCLSGFFTKLTIIFISTKIIVNADKILKSNISTDQSCQNKKSCHEDNLQGWARIVTKISEAMNVLTGHNDADEEGIVANKIEQWIEGCDK